VVSVFAGNGTAGSADGLGHEANFRWPWGIAIDQRNGDIYVSDAMNRIRKINQQGYVSTFAPSFSDPTGLCISEREDCLYIVETYTHAIRRLHLRTGVVSLVAGGNGEGFLDGDGAAAKFRHPRGVAYVSNDGSLLVADTGNCCIRRIKFQGRRTVVATIAGTARKSGIDDGDPLKSRFLYPYFLCVDDACSTCYVADYTNCRVRQFPLT